MVARHQSDVITLRELGEDDEPAFLLGYQDWLGEDLVWHTFVWKPGMSHQDHLKILQDQKDKSKIPSNRVPSTMLYAFFNGNIIGRFSIRHELNDFLLERGGHVGYSVSPRYRKNGYASEMFRLGMKHCQRLGLKRILVTCADQNTPSWKIIEKFGGSLENRIFDAESSEFVRRYWLNTNIEDFDRSKVSHKAVAFITRYQNAKTQILVFDHDPEFHDAGTQVPSGTVDPGEKPEETVLREVLEESGLDQLNIENKLDQYQFYGDFAKKFLCRHVYHLSSPTQIADSWTHTVKGSGGDKGLKFHYFWIDLDAAKGRLSARFDDSVDLLIRKLGL